MMIAFVLAAVVGCSKDKKVAKPTPTTAKPVAAKPADDKLLETLPADQQVSPNLSLSGDIVQMCGIKATANATAAPTFDYDKEELHPEDRAVLDQLATCLMTGALKGRSVALTGRADPRGTEEYNLGLGSRRAASVSTYLVRLGVGEPQLGVTTRGSLDASGTDEAGWAKDRRVDITLAN
ncbi:MAG TPA: OmpA family protein [Kofleriaceae bacterium]|nr:OmpA family protein [Kofleriaceae bacterium]